MVPPQFYSLPFNFVHDFFMCTILYFYLNKCIKHFLMMVSFDFCYSTENQIFTYFFCLNFYSGLIFFLHRPLYCFCDLLGYEVRI